MTKPEILTIRLADPIPYGKEKTLEEITIRHPTAGDLRGVYIARIGEMDVTELFKLLPRVSVENIQPGQLSGLSARDVTNIFHELQLFFLPAGMKEQATEGRNSRTTY